MHLLFFMISIEWIVVLSCLLANIWSYVDNIETCYMFYFLSSDYLATILSEVILPICWVIKVWTSFLTVIYSIFYLSYCWIITGVLHCSVQHGRWQPWWYDVHTAAATATTTTTTQFTRCIWWHGIQCSESTIRYDDASERPTESSQFHSTETTKSTVIELSMAGFSLEWNKPCFTLET